MWLFSSSVVLLYWLWLLLLQANNSIGGDVYEIDCGGQKCVNLTEKERLHVPHYGDRIRFNGTLPSPTAKKLPPGKQAPKVSGDEKFKPPVVQKPDPNLTPDWKVEEMPPEPYSQSYYGEFERPYKLQPFTMSATYWDNSKDNYDNPQLLGCYCCTVYKKSIPLAGCAVLTSRHILTTATSTELVLAEHATAKTLENILGAWYDIADYATNNSVYMTPARIHYHPKYIMPDSVNASHPIPGIYDLAVWAATHPFYKKDAIRTYICNRAGSYWLQFGSPTLGSVKQPVAIIVGFQFIMWYHRRPLPFYKYAVKTQKYTRKCPKSEWGWFFCVWGRWAGHGLDSGAALHRATQGQSWLYDGLLGIHSFSMDLRAKDMTFYFIPVENHEVLSWMYDAYMGRLGYRWLDGRFEDTEWRAPKPKKGYKVEWNFDTPPMKMWPHFDPPLFYKK